MKQIYRLAIDTFMKSLPEKYIHEQEKIAKELEKQYQEFVQQFKLDQNAVTAIVSKQPYDLIVDCRQTTEELAHLIAEYLKK